MSDNQALLLKISELAGQINRHKNQTEPPAAPPYAGSYNTQRPSPYPANQSSRGRGWSHPRYARGCVSPRRTRPRGTWNNVSVTHHNKTLVINNNKSRDEIATTPAASSSSSSRSHTDGSVPSPTTGIARSASSDSVALSQEGWVAKHDRHRQLINTAVYDQHSQARTRALEKTRQEKLQRKGEREKQKLRGYLSRTRDSTSQGPYEVIVQGERYKVAAGGSKLVRIIGEGKRTGNQRQGFFLMGSAMRTDDPKGAKTTPKKAVVGGVSFVRSKNGNLWRVGLVKASHESMTPRKIQEPCKYFSNTGLCKYGMLCPYTHNPDKVAICTRFLTSKSCPVGDSCDLSHNPSPHCMPTCVHFLRGNCSNENCPFPHINVSPAAPICRPFATLGYCDKGADCTERHVRHCPDFDEKGVCTDTTCKLPHVERAARKRIQAAAAAAKAQGSGTNNDMDWDSDISSEDEGEAIDSEDIDSDTLSEYEYVRRDTHLENFASTTMQDDFIHFTSSQE